MVAAEEIWKPRKVHNHDRKSAYRNDGRVRNGEEVSDTYDIANAIKQWCVPAPTIFSIFQSAMLKEAFRDMGDGIYIQSRQNADLFTVAHFRAKTKTTNIIKLY